MNQVSMGEITCWGAGISPDGRYVFYGGTKSGRVWDTQTGKLIRSWAKSDVTHIAISPDGKRLVTVRRALLEDLDKTLSTGAIIETCDLLTGVEMAPRMEYAIT